MVGLGSVTILKTTIRGFTSEAIELNGGANARAMVADSYITYNAGGVTVGAVGANVNAAFLLNVIMDANTAFAVKVGPNDTVAMSNSFLGGSAASIISVVGSVVQSYGNNIIRNSGVPNQTLPLQ